MKLSKTQQRVYDELTSALAVIKKYATHEEFFINSKGEQNKLTTAFHCNCYFNSPEKYQNEDPDGWKRLQSNYYRAKNENILTIYAKTETVKALEKAGLIEIIEEAKYKGCSELVKVL